MVRKINFAPFRDVNFVSSNVAKPAAMRPQAMQKSQSSQPSPRKPDFIMKLVDDYDGLDESLTKKDDITATILKKRERKSPCVTQVSPAKQRAS